MSYNYNIDNKEYDKSYSDKTDYKEKYMTPNKKIRIYFENGQNILYSNITDLTCTFENIEFTEVNSDGTTTQYSFRRAKIAGYSIQNNG